MRRLSVFTALAVFGLCFLPSFATADALDIPAAAPPQFRALLRAKLHLRAPRYGFESSFALKAQHGYTVTVVGEGDIVVVEVSRPLPHGKRNLLEEMLGFKQSVTAYVARGTVTEHRIAASFGKFGNIDVRFRPKRRVLESRRRRHCRRGDRSTGRLGVFVGGVRFSGEGGSSRCVPTGSREGSAPCSSTAARLPIGSRAGERGRCVKVRASSRPFSPRPGATRSPRSSC